MPRHARLDSSPTAIAKFDSKDVDYFRKGVADYAKHFCEGPA
jgi:hypothetical protein